MKVLCRCSDIPYALSEEAWKEESGQCEKCGSPQVPLVTLENRWEKISDEFDLSDLSDLSDLHLISAESDLSAQPFVDDETETPTQESLPILSDAEKKSNGNGQIDQTFEESDQEKANANFVSHRYRDLATRHLHHNRAVNPFLLIFLGFFVIVGLWSGLLIMRHPVLLDRLFGYTLPDMPAGPNRQGVGSSSPHSTLVSNSEMASISKTVAPLLLKGRRSFLKDTKEGYQNAIEAFSQALKIQEHAPEARSSLVESYVLLSLNHGEGDLEKAKELAQKSVQENPESSASYRARAAVALAYNNIEQALMDIDRALFLNPLDALSYCLYGDILQKVEGGQKFSILAYNNALALNPKIVRARYGLALVLNAMDQYHEAIVQAEKLLQSPEDSSRAQSLIEAIEANIQQEKLARADKNATSAPLSSIPDKEAIATTTSPIEKASMSSTVDPKNTQELLVATVTTQTASKEFVVQRKDFAPPEKNEAPHPVEFHELTPANPPTAKTEKNSDRPSISNLLTQARNAYKQGNYENAKGTLLQAIERDTQNSEVLTMLGYVYFSLQNYAEARKYFKETLRNNPNYADAHRGLGKIYEARGDRFKAIDAFQTYLLLFPMGPHAKEVEQSIALLTKN